MNALLVVYSHIQLPIPFVRADGMYLYDQDGRAYLDFYGGHCVCCLGHNPPKVIEAISAQAKEFFFYSNLVNIPFREECARALIRFAANGLTKAFFCNSGAEANENALKVAIKKTGRQKIAAFKGAFHGRTTLAAGATDNPRWHEIYRSWRGPVERLTPNALDELSRLGADVAAVILEPIQSIGGVTVFQADYLRELKSACEKIGALLIFDEVQTGMGRTGAPFVSGHCGVLPDIMTLAKGLAGGFPIGGVVMTDAVADTVSPGDIAATFGGNPLAMAAMQATVHEIERQGLVDRASAMESLIRKRFTGPHVKAVQGRGLLLGLILDREAKPVQRALLERGVVASLNSNPFMLHLLPPLTVQEEHVDVLHERLTEALESLEER
jgi:acetylornithine/succinyldiaminopimelate/putrescine aminotransferase